MKGMVFTELLEMIEDSFSADMVDDILDECDLESGGAYTAVGTYDHREALTLVTALSRRTGADVSVLVRTFGGHLFQRFVAMYPDFFEGIHSTTAFLATIENHIHVEVRKLYPDAELPRFEHQLHDDGSFELVYQSSRPFADLAEGLILGCIEHYNDGFALERDDVAGGSNGTGARFTLRPTA